MYPASSFRSIFQGVVAGLLEAGVMVVLAHDDSVIPNDGG
jgi:hypothetical protein